MKFLPNNPTKAQEIEWFNRFFDNLPRTCYLRAIFDGMGEEIEEMIRDDICCYLKRDIRAMEHRRKDLVAERDEKSKQINKIEHALALLKCQKNDLVAQIKALSKEKASLKCEMTAEVSRTLEEIKFSIQNA